MQMLSFCLVWPDTVHPDSAQGWAHHIALWCFCCTHPSGTFKFVVVMKKNMNGFCTSKEDGEHFGKTHTCHISQFELL